MRIKLSAMLAVLVLNGLTQGQNLPSQSSFAQQFILDPDRPFVYVRFDHIGDGVRFESDEPRTRIWLHLVNNSRVPIIVRTFGVPAGAVKGEVGLLHDVIEDQRIMSISPTPETPRASDHSESSTKPPGYEAELSSAATIDPAQGILFSVPITHIGKSWHIEIPISFDLPRANKLRDETVGGEPVLRIIYGSWDLPPSAKKTDAR